MTHTKIRTTIVSMAAAFAVAVAAAPAAQAAPIQDRGMPNNSDSEACFKLHWKYRMEYENVTIYRRKGFAGAVDRVYAAERANEALKEARRLGCRWAQPA